ncbi:uncharacterized protein LOC106647468 [Copidosoma floridanum]|uniref:uncharacterized protein LOC106647468 n=1 Tax=Copidosoma floridanum TaxID=29053 RepID=UPI000C6F4D85|nr:uncharacterized protein LOC106647468 [Copidosoma floridanum]
MAHPGVYLELLLLPLLMLSHFCHAQFTWTPIYVGGESQIDLWTQSMSGCSCGFNSSQTACACCVPRGGCSCGAAMPNRCTQCGLENYCSKMCNVTLDSRQLFSKSDRGFGQIKSPQLQGPSSCTYRFVPDTGQRVELQVWRIISIGRHNGTACEGGWLEFEGGPRICGRDLRLHQPIVLFSDKPEPILRVQINESTERSQVYAFYSFASTASTSVGWPARGGRQLPDTECDWIYEEHQCHRGCVLASPGYPGLYPPNSRCRYLITSNRTVTINISFTAVLMPMTHCTSNYIAVYAGQTTNSALLRTLCEKKTGSVVHVGRDLLVEFRSGAEVSPFDYNGFVATLNFVEITTEAPTTASTTTTVVESTSKAQLIHLENGLDALVDSPYSVTSPSGSQQQQRNGSTSGAHHQRSNCDVEVSGDKLRMGFHSTRSRTAILAALPVVCRLSLIGRDYDTVHVSLANYSLNLDSCKSQIEVLDGPINDKSSPSHSKSIGKICSHDNQLTHQKQTPYNEPRRFSSSSRNMTIILTRASDEDYLDVSYYFHNERESGTQQPKTHCDVEYYGLRSPRTGKVVHPKVNRFSSGNVKCKQYFIPAANQAVIITLNSTMNQTHDSQCTTQCGDQGCRCASNRSLDDIDHLLLVSRVHGNTLACLCGNNRDWLPVEFWSTTPVYIEWSRSSHTSLNLSADYEFADDTFCGSYQANAGKLEGEIRAGFSANFSFALNRYYQQKCTYLIEVPANRELVIMIESSQTRPCTAWNLTVHEYNKTSANNEGPRLHTFCSRDIARNFTIGQEKRSVIVKLQALGRTVPQYVLRWRSQSALKSRKKNSPNSSINVAMVSSSVSPSLGGSSLFLLLLVLKVLVTT